MAKPNTHLEWCVVRLGEDLNWWVDEVSDPVHWDVDGLSIIDPRQLAHLIDLLDPLREYALDTDLVESALITFRIDKDLGNGRVRLVRVKDYVLESEDKLFALPDIVDEENGPYADFLDHITRLRVKMLNDIFDFEQKLSIDEVEDDIREIQNNNFIEGRAVHAFDELTSILDYVPEGWELDEDEAISPAKKDESDDFPDVEEEDEEALKDDETLRWDDEDDEEKDEESDEVKVGLDEGDDEEEDDEEEDEDEIDEKKSKPRIRKKR